MANAPVAVRGLDRDRRPAIYGRAVRSAAGGGMWLQYWLFYRSNDQDRGIVRSGRHSGDWEMVQILIDERARPLQVVYAQHSGAERWTRGRATLAAARAGATPSASATGATTRSAAASRGWPAWPGSRACGGVAGAAAPSDRDRRADRYVYGVRATGDGAPPRRGDALNGRT